jgi:hypothetical protein
MVRPAGLILIGYWSGSGASESWPNPEDMVDSAWDKEDRDAVADYLQRGHIARLYMGYSPCRICGERNGVLELSDGTFVWPEGLRHYVIEHQVRLPDRFIDHVFARIEALETAQREESWWASQKRAKTGEH